jgi:peptidoglycan/LPS O-acetylase OafA/YrhL
MIFEALTRRPLPISAIGMTLIVVPYVLDKLHWLTALTLLFGASFENIGFVILMMVSVVLPDWGACRALNCRVIVWVGVLSYSIYIWQHIFCTDPAVFGLGDVWWMSFPGWLIPVFLTATISYYCLERPLLGLRGKLR